VQAYEPIRPGRFRHESSRQHFPSVVELFPRLECESAVRWHRGKRRARAARPSRGSNYERREWRPNLDSSMFLSCPNRQPGPEISPLARFSRVFSTAVSAPLG